MAKDFEAGEIVKSKRRQMHNRAEQKIVSANLRRRDFLERIAAAPFALVFVAGHQQSALATQRQSLVLQQQPPVTMVNAPNSRAFPFASLNSWITPNSEFFVRSHFGIPKIETSRWMLEVKGAVERAKRPAQERVERRSQKNTGE